MVKRSDAQLLDQVQAALKSALRGIPFVEIRPKVERPSAAGSKADLVMEVGTPSGGRTLIVEAKSSGQPRLAREAVNQLRRYLEVDRDAYGVFAAPFVTAQGAEICKREGMGFLDLSGNCYLCFDQVFVERQGRPNRFARKRDLRSLYSPKATRVLRVLLEAPGRVWKLSEIAQEATVSVGQTFNVRKLLEDREWLRKDEGGFHLVNPLALLEEWSGNYSYRNNQSRDFHSLKPIIQIEQELAGACESQGLPYALGLFSAAERIAAAVRYERAWAYIQGDPGGVISKLDLKEVRSGANVTILSPYDDGVFYGTRKYDGIKVVSAIQAYLDLSSHRGRGEEAAEAILERVIKPRW